MPRRKYQLELQCRLEMQTAAQTADSINFPLPTQSDTHINIGHSNLFTKEVDFLFAPSGNQTRGRSSFDGMI